jgi:RimJ/RimL family protein N-acetyltransferase
MKIEPIVLTGKFVRLEPLGLEHVPGLTRVGLDADIWRLMVYGEMQTEDDMRNWVLKLLDHQAAGTDLPFAVVLQATNQPVGCTRYLNIDVRNRSLEVGGTWYGAAFQRTAVNTESKYLMLKHAFETLQAVRVQLKTDLRNERSQRAIERLGAVKEGILRNHMILPDGHVRDSVFYSILPDEWPAVKARLEEKLK